MGLLDDAIRQHLELKRQHGAPDDEIERAEQEALGPARREPSAGPDMPPVQQVQGDEIEPAEPEPQGEELEPVAVEPPPPPPIDEGEDDYLAPAPMLDELEEAPPPGTPKPHGDPAFGHHPEPIVSDGEPAEDLEPSPARDDPFESDYDEPDEVPSQEQLAPSAEEPPDRARTTILDDPLDQGDEDADVLEETPDFLQDAPEHDKLWFEQKPPRDFDFD